MEEFWILILVAFSVTNSRDKAESVQLEELEELPLQTFDEIFGEGWWDKDKADEWDKLTLEHNFHHEIDRQNTQLGQIEPNSTDQNPPLTVSDHSDNAKNAEDERKRKIIDKFHAMRDEFKQKRKYSKKEWVQIDNKIAKHLKVSRKKIYKWKKEFGINQKVFYKKERQILVEKFDQRKAELKRAGIKNSQQNQINKFVAKELDLSLTTIYNWKRKLGQTAANKYAHDKQKELLMKSYYKIKDKTPKIRDEDIAKMLKIGSATLVRWKSEFKRQQFHVDSRSI